jgi:nucleotide-binding universal stress UspA family protein
LSTAQETQFETAPARPGEQERPDGERRQRTRGGLFPQGGRSAAGDLVLPVDGRAEVEVALEHSIKIAKTYGARIVLMYVTGEATVPRGYAEYAKVERIRDYHFTYLNSVGDSTIATLRRRIEREGVECTGRAFVGSLADAIRVCQMDPRVLMLVLAVPHKSVLAKLGNGRFKLGAISHLRVPVVLVPA